MLTREEILSRKVELARETVAVPEWGGEVFVRMLTAEERDRFEVTTADCKRKNFRARLTAYAVCDHEGKNLFSESDVTWLSKQPAAALARIADVALRLSRFTSDDVKDLEKNSEGSPSDASS
jgi:hypothetical protein